MSNNYLPDTFSQYIYKSRYSRYLDKEGRREEWPETIARYFDFFTSHLKENHAFTLTDELRSELETAVLQQEIMPSMRSLMTAGVALERDHVAGYNCAAHPIESLKTLDEELFILMNGTGDGFSVESRFTNKLEELPDEYHATNTTIIVEDSKLGWAKAYRELLNLLASGQVPKYDVSRLRPAGARLKTFGGRSSGPAPLVELFDYTIALFKSAAGRKLTSLELHDLACMVASIVVVGGVRRSALISLSDLTDERMRHAKSGDWWNTQSQRRLSNNSAVYEEKPDVNTFLKEWHALYQSKSGERGIFSREAVKKVITHSNEFRKTHFGENVRVRDLEYDFLCNPCSEIILRPYEFCNLSEIIIRESDDEKSLQRKVRLATILGTFQSTLTNFRYLNKKWQRNCEDERLLGVSMTGIYDNELTNGSRGQEALQNILTTCRKLAITTNIEFAEKLGINSSVAITTVKPSGTVSALNGTASGIHPRHSEYYIRHASNDVKDPLTPFLQKAGVPWEPSFYDPKNMVVFKFPVKSPSHAKFRKDVSAIEHLELWKTYQIYWAEHKPSITVNVKEDEWIQVASWVYDNFEWMSGVSFLPYSDHVYKQAPFTDCSQDEYEELRKVMPTHIEWAGLTEYEKEDMTTGSQELSCAAGGCEIT